MQLAHYLKHMDGTIEWLENVILLTQSMTDGGVPCLSSGF
jgi:hypothetical protein